MSEAALSQAPRASLAPLAAPLAAILGALALRLVVMTCPDVSWLISVSERMLAGGRLYVDVLETNPPASIWLYLPQTALAERLGLRPEVVVDASVFLFVIAMLALTRRIAADGGLARDYRRPLLLGCALATLLAMPLVAFGEREHFALAALLPAMAICAARAAGGRPPALSALAAGLCAGLVVVIKPPFALALIGPWVYVALRRRAPALLLAPEYFVAGLLALAYLGAALALHREYFDDVLPLVRSVYLPLRMPPLALLDRFWPIGLALGVAILAALRGWPAERERAPADLLSLAAAGFVLAALVQGKGFLYHFLPALGCGVLAGALRLCLRERAGTLARLPPLAASLLLVGLSLFMFSRARDTAELGRTIAALTPRPTILAVTPDLGVGHPMTRDIGGRWANSVGHQWMAASARQLLAHRDDDARARAGLEAAERRDHDVLLADLARERPDIVLFQRDQDADWRRWAMADPRFAEAFAGYARAAVVGDIEVWRRR